LIAVASRFAVLCALRRQTTLSGDHSAVEPPDPIPNSEVKRSRADGSAA
jgi:hypothetical protein